MTDLMLPKIGLKLGKKVETSIWAAKLVMFCVGIVSTVIFFKATILPYTFNLILSTRPPLWVFLRSWLSPPYIYILLNLIIITIAASTKTLSCSLKINDNNNHSWQSIEEEEEEKEEENEEEVNPSLSIDKSIDDPSKQTSDSSEKEPEKITGEGAKVMEEEEETLDTLEDAWKLIREGKGKTKERQLKKSDTWDTPPRVVVQEEEVGYDDNDDDPVVAWARQELRKSNTFNDRVTMVKRNNHNSIVTRDELTQRVEAFIKKFHDDMRLQRQESEQLFMEIINRSV